MSTHVAPKLRATQIASAVGLSPRDYKSLQAFVRVHVKQQQQAVQDVRREEDPDQLLTPQEAAELLGVSRRYVLRLGIPRAVGGRHIRFRLADVWEYMRGR